MIKKRVLSLVLSLLMLLSITPVTALAEGSNVSMTVTPSTGTMESLHIGDSVTVVVSNTAMTVSTFTFNIAFDTEKFECTSIVGNDEDYKEVVYLTKESGRNPDLEATSISSITEANGNGHVGFGWAQTGDTSFKAGNIVTITFTAKAVGSASFVLSEDSDGSNGYKGEAATVGATILKAPITSVTVADLDAPVKGAAPDTEVTVTPSGLTSVVKWYTGETEFTGDTFAAGTAYTAAIILNATDGDNFAESVTGPNGYEMTRDSATQLTLKKTFPATKSDTICNAPTGVTAAYGQKLSDIALSNPSGNTPGTWAWVNGNTSVGDVGTRTYKANFTPTNTIDFDAIENIDIIVTVTPKNLSAVTVTDIADQGYTGSKIEPAVTVTGDGQTLVQGKDYIVEYGENTNAGIGTVTVKAKDGGNYSFADVTKEFNITAVAANIIISEPSEIIYDGNAVAAAKAGETGADLFYTYTGDGKVTVKWYADDNGEKGSELIDGAPKNAGVYWIGISAEAGTNYTPVSEAVKRFTIGPKTVTPTVTLSTSEFTYDAAAKKPVVTVRDGETVLAGNTDYTVAYADNTNVGTGKVKVTLKGNYSGSSEASFTIVPAVLTMTATVDSKSYDGTAAGTIRPGDLNGVMTDDSAKVKIAESSITGTFSDQYAGTGKAVTAGSNFTLTGEAAKNYTLMQPTGLTGAITAATNILTSDHTSINRAKELTRGGNTIDLKSLVSMTAGNAFKDKLIFTLVSDGANGTTLTGNTLTSGTTEGTVTIKVTCPAINAGGTDENEYGAAAEIAIYVKIVDKAVDTTTLKVVQGDVEYGTAVSPTVSNKPAGAGDVTFSYEKFDGSVYETYTGTPTEPGKYKVTAQCESGTVIYKAAAEFEVTRKTLTVNMVGDIAEQDYTGSAIEPSVIVTVNGTVLTKGTDYTMAYTNNTNAGTAAMTITGIGNYQGVVSKNFTINKVAPTVTAPIANRELVYNGAAQSLITAGTVIGGTMQYSLSNANGNYTTAVPTATNAGSYTVWYRVVGDANHTNIDTSAIPVTIAAKSSVDGMIQPIDSQVFTGEAIEPAVIVKDGNTTLVKGTDYTVTYTNNTNVGTAIVTVTYKGNYNGTQTANFNIIAKSLSGATITVDEQVYTGSALTPAVTVKDGSRVLVKDTDYTVSYANNTNVGTATVTITGTGNYAGTKDAAFDIKAKSIDGAAIAAIAEQIYNGAAATPELTVTDGTKTLVKDVDYTVSYTNNTDAGTATATVTGSGNYTGKKSVTFTIAPAVLTMTATVDSKSYDGAAAATIRPGNLSGVMTGDSAKVKIAESSITGTFSDQYAGTDKAVTAESSFTLTGEAAKNYALMQPTGLMGTITTATNILTSGHISADSAKELARGGNTIDLKSLVSMTAGDSFKDKLTFTLTGTEPSGTTLTGSTLTSGTTEGTVTIKVTCPAINAGGTDENEYGAAAEIAIYVKIVDKAVDITTLKVVQGDVEYGTAVSPTVSNKPADTGDVTFSYEKFDGTTYETYAGTPTEPGKYKVTAQCESGTVIYKAAAEFEVTRKTLTANMVGDIAAQDYSGSALEPSVIVTVNGAALVKGTDYTMAYTNNTNAGTAAMTITGIGNYQGKVSKNFTINKVAPTVTAPIANSELTYNGAAQALVTAGKVTGGTVEYRLGANGNYTTTIPTAKNAGSYTVWYRVEGDVNHTNVDAAAIPVTIAAKPSVNGMIQPIGSQVFTGEAIEPAVTVKDGDTTLAKGTDYTVTYTNNTNVGTATVTVTYKGNYSGTQTANFDIIAKSLSGVTITVDEQIYTGSALTPTVTVKDGNRVLVKDTDYTVSYANNINVGTATVTITGTGNYAGTESASFEIKAKSIAGAAIAAIAEQIYTGTAATPELTVTDGTKALVRDVDYTVSYTNNADAGTATATVIGTGNYTGKKSVTFTIKANTVAVSTDGKKVSTASPTVTDLTSGMKQDAYKNRTGETTDAQYLANIETALRSKIGAAAGNSLFFKASVSGGDTTSAAVIPYPAGADKTKDFRVAKIDADGTITEVAIVDITKLNAGLKLTLKDGELYMVSWATHSDDSDNDDGGHRHPGGAPTISAEKTNDKAASATDYTSGIYGLTFRSTASYASFKGVQVDGKTIAAKNYIAEEGSIVVYLKAVYLRTLAVGTHTVTILSSEGNASMDFTIGGVSTSPRTFDSGIAMYVAMAATSMAGLAWLGKKRED